MGPFTLQRSSNAWCEKGEQSAPLQRFQYDAPYQCTVLSTCMCLCVCICSCICLCAGLHVCERPRAWTVFWIWILPQGEIWNIVVVLLADSHSHMINCFLVELVPFSVSAPRPPRRTKPNATLFHGILLLLQFGPAFHLLVCELLGLS